MTRDAWLKALAYLEPIARLQAEVEEAAAGLRTPAPALPRWDEHASELGAGIPLLRSASVAVDLELGRHVAPLVDAFARGRDDERSRTGLPCTSTSWPRSGG